MLFFSMCIYVYVFVYVYYTKKCVFKFAFVAKRKMHIQIHLTHA